MKPQITIDQFTYHLPDSKIATYPLAQRDDSKLLVYNNQQITESTFRDLKTFLPANALLIFNNTKVIRARLAFKKSTGANIEIFCLEPAENKDMQELFSSTTAVRWKCIVGNLKKWKSGAVEAFTTVGSKTIKVEATQISREGESVIVEFNWNDTKVSFGELLDQLGSTPIPPYLNRPSETIDTERYQTVYSQHKGSVAAPTAGLHFTDEVIAQLHQQGIKTAQVTLHVGAGTFKPVKSATIDQHEMHSELFRVDKSTIELILSHRSPIIAVGTTTVRTLESLYWAGIKLLINKPFHEVGQWDAYEIKEKFTIEESLNAILNHLTTTNQTAIDIQTSIMIAPSYKFKVIDGLVTNFHQPQSTLLLLIGALIGDDWHKVYDYALSHDFRFLSYGDSSFLYNPRH